MRGPKRPKDCRGDKGAYEREVEAAEILAMVTRAVYGAAAERLLAMATGLRPPYVYIIITINA